MSRAEINDISINCRIDCKRQGKDSPQNRLYVNHISEEKGQSHVGLGLTKRWASGKGSVLTGEGDLRSGEAGGATLQGSVQQQHYLSHHLWLLEAALVLCVWKTGQQDLVMGRFIPQGEAHPQLVGVQALHSDVGVPQAACSGCRHGLGVRGGCACKVPSARPPVAIT